VCGKQVAELEELGFLARSTVYPTTPELSRVKMLAGDYTPGALAALMSDGKLIGRVVEHWLQHAAGLPTVAFGVSVAHSRLIERHSNEAGIPPAHIDGKSSDDERRKAIEGLRTGAILVLCNFGLIRGWRSAGTGRGDHGAPDQITSALFADGRARRLPYPGKDRAVILDHAVTCASMACPMSRASGRSTVHRRGRRDRPEQRVSKLFHSAITPS
jgi:hypothetical protein